MRNDFKDWSYKYKGGIIYNNMRVRSFTCNETKYHGPKNALLSVTII